MSAYRLDAIVTNVLASVAVIVIMGGLLATALHIDVSRDAATAAVALQAIADMAVSS